MSQGEDEFERYMDAAQTTLQLKAGQTLTQEQVDEIQFASEYERRDHEHQIDVFHKGYEAGRLNAVGATKAALLEQVDLLKTELAVTKGLLRFYTAKPKKSRVSPRARFDGDATP